MTDQRVNQPRPGALAPVRRSSGMLVFLALFVAPPDARSQLAPTTEHCIRVEVRNDQFLDVNIRPYVNGIAVGEKLYVQGLRSGSFSLRAATYLNAQLQFAIDPVGSSEVHFVPGHSGLHIASTSTLVEIRVASRIWLSTLSLVDLEDPPSGCPPPRQAARSGREIDPAHLDPSRVQTSGRSVRPLRSLLARISHTVAESCAESGVWGVVWGGYGDLVGKSSLPQIQLEQVGEAAQLRRDLARQVIVTQAQSYQVGERAQFRRDLARQRIVAKIQPRHVGKGAEFLRDRAG